MPKLAGSSRASRRRKASDLPEWGVAESSRTCGTALRQLLRQFVAGDILGGSRDFVALVDDDQIPARADQVVKPLDVVLRDLLRVQPRCAVLRLDGIHGGDHLGVPLPGVLAAQGRVRAPVPRQHEVERLAEQRVHLDDPLQQQALGGEDQNALHHARAASVP